ncbi:hybrid sensor histidine kinase/response regulator [Pseudomonas sp. PLB05]|uniref:hybrid sensor histidine kinase/response regulator n=1 Tax=Pseudomonas sp. PLB05 TaxID=2899078 RepID=UPI001E653AA9|nr:response regulator [Pseudomonas sp. PLB05]MCD4863271.1 response regulator [Pseudomonas sp. PLB05]
MSQPPRDVREMSLYDLFASEVQSHLQALDSGLLRLERDPSDTGVIEPMMRAAHSIKGAARIVDLDGLVELAHAMEDCLVAVQAGRRHLGPADIDQLFRCVDVLGEVSRLDEAASQRWQSEQRDAQRALAQALTAGAAAPAPMAPARELAPAVAEDPAPEAERSRDPLRVDSGRFNQILALTSEARVMGLGLHGLVQGFQGYRAELQGLFGQANAVSSDVRQRQEGLLDRYQQQLQALEAYERRLLGVCQGLLDEVLGVRMRPLRDAVQGFPRLVRDLARGLDKEAVLQVEGADTLIDREVLARLESPLNHLLRNAVDHGLETPAERRALGKPECGQIRLEARHVAGRLQVSLHDDGRGLDLERIRAAVIARRLSPPPVAAELSAAELLEFLLLPGFSLKETVTELSGRGVGLDVVADAIRALDGEVRLETRPGLGFTTHLLVPVSRSIVRALIVDIAGEAYALPVNRIERVLRLDPAEVHALEGKAFFLLGEDRLGLVAAHQLLELEGAPPSGDLAVLVIGSGARRYGLVVDRLRGEQGLALKPLDEIFGKLRSVTAGALLDDGSPVLLLDVADLLTGIERLLGEGQLRQVQGGAAVATRRVKRILVVDDSLTVREMERKLLEGQGYQVEVAVDGMDGWNAVRGGEFDMLLSDIDMPRMNGIELVELVRRDPRLHALPVMIVSYKDRPEDRLKGMQAGADYYLTKGSFHDDALITAVQDLIGAP